MSIKHTAYSTLDVPHEEIDLESWVLGLSDEDYQACARGHHGAGSYRDERGRGTVNVESVGGSLIVQHYRIVRVEDSSVELYSAASRVYLFHLIPVRAGVRWTLETRPRTSTSTDFACTVEVILPPVLDFLGRMMALSWFIRRHTAEETPNFAADIARKYRRRHAAVR
ncbi:hypothetical protein Aph01nite_32790 [Acrocarpospora phusangensis]|uniref:Uncharacterized protein n=1 Tax=Acrocarpospora phusangensis TaxID=1070424 RepID=A0A919QC33_9ACTN|nr:hypothetical protein [Acrocarpospora phusangensis]GIH24969.1 hypothetical protein Aph01nite_32790 [Acrocarpospora phusangensis]